MKAWIQKHDFTSQEFEAPDSSYAKRVLGEFDWLAELNQQAEEGTETCDPGLGLVMEDGHILHLCPNGRKRHLIHFHFPRKNRFSALILGGLQTETLFNISLEKAEQMIDAFYSKILPASDVAPNPSMQLTVTRCVFTFSDD